MFVFEPRDAQIVSHRSHTAQTSYQNNDMIDEKI